MSSYHPATNRFAAINATLATPPPPRRRLPRLVIVENDTEAPPIEYEDRRIAASTDYAREYRATMSREDHKLLVLQIARRQGVCYAKAQQWTEYYRRTTGLAAPRPDPLQFTGHELAFLDLLKRAPGHVATSEEATDALGLQKGTVADVAYMLRTRLARLAGTNEATGLLVTLRNPNGYLLRYDDIAHYPAIVAAWARR